MNNFTIREYTETDKPHLISLTEESNKYYISLDPLKRVRYNEKSAEFFTNQMLEKAQENGKTFVAEEDGHIVGFISGHITKPNEEEQIETVNKKPGIVDEFFVTKKYRGCGIGTKLFTTMEEYFKSRGCDIIRLMVFSPNKLARDFYREKGYEDRLVTVMKIVK